MAKIITLTEAGSIALHAMVLIAKSEGKLNVVKISEATGSSKHHVAKVMQRLVKDNYLTSDRGPYGGFALKKEPGDISLLDIYTTIEGDIEISSCAMGHLKCPFESCILGDLAKRMSLDFKEYLGKRTLADYISGDFK
mgnify:CR=1 FL=1